MKIDAIQAMPLVCVRLFHSRKKLQKKLDKKKFRIELVDAPAQTVSFEQEGGFTVSIVLIECDDISESTMALLAHEAVHVAQAYLESLGEDKPSSEFEAYLIQHISEYLFEEHYAWVGKHSEG